MGVEIEREDEEEGECSTSAIVAKNNEKYSVVISVKIRFWIKKRGGLSMLSTKRRMGEIRLGVMMKKGGSHARKWGFRMEMEGILNKYGELKESDWTNGKWRYYFGIIKTPSSHFHKNISILFLKSYTLFIQL